MKCSNFPAKIIQCVNKGLFMAAYLVSLKAGNPYWKGKLNTVDLLWLTSFTSASFDNENINYFFEKTDTLMRRSAVLSLPLKLVFLVDELVWNKLEVVINMILIRAIPGKTNKKGRFDTVDLLVKVACFVKKRYKIFFRKSR